MIKGQTNLSAGDGVIFVQHYLRSEPQHLLLDKVGEVQSSADEEGYVMVQFNHHKPGTLTKVSVDDIELLRAALEEEISPIPADSYHDLEEAENHELGGMSRAQLIQQKLEAQETDPALDRSIRSMLR